MARRISKERKTAFYVGTGLMIVGFLSFASTFVTFAMSFGDFTDIESKTRSGMLRAFGGMGLMILGMFVRGIGARGLAGAGVVLDPDRARGELEPYSRMAGGMVKDALDEADIDLGARSEKVVVIKCAACGKLNEDDSKFCQECGKPL